MTKSEFENMIEMINNEETSINVSTLITNKNLSKKRVPWRIGIIIAFALICILPVVANVIQNYIANGLVWGKHPGVAENIDNGKGQLLNEIVKVDEFTYTFEYALFDEREIYLIYTGEMNEEDANKAGELAKFFIGDVTINGVEVAAAMGNSETDWLREINGIPTKRYFMTNIVHSEKITYPATLKFTTNYFEHTENGLEIRKGEEVTMVLKEKYIEKPIVIDINKELIIEDNQFKIEKLELTHTATYLYVKADPNNTSILGDLLFSLNGEDNKISKYTKEGLKRIGKDFDDTLVFVGESRLSDINEITSLQFLYAGLIDKNTYYTTLNLETLEVIGSGNKIKRAVKYDGNMGTKWISFEGSYNRGELSNRYPIVVPYEEKGYSKELFVTASSFGSSFEITGVDDAKIPVIFRGMKDVYLDKIYVLNNK